MAKRRYKVGTEIGIYSKGTAKRQFKDGLHNLLYQGQTKKRAHSIKRILKKSGDNAHVLKKDDGYSVYYKKKK